MRVKFNGLVEKRSKGCHVCGKRSTDSQFVMKKRYILPSGRIETFRVGEEVEVSDEDGNFLMLYNGAFTKV